MGGLSHLGQASYLVSPQGDRGLVHRGDFPVRAPLAPAGARTAEWLLKPRILGQGPLDILVGAPDDISVKEAVHILEGHHQRL